MELEINVATETGRSATYLDLHLEMDSKQVKNKKLQQES